MANTSNQGQATKDKVKDAAHGAVDQASDFASRTADKAGGMASQAADKARDLASQAADKARDFAGAAGDRADNATSSVGSGLRSAADTVRHNLPSEGYVGTAASSVAGGLDSAGRYLEDRGLSGVADDLAGLIKRNPIPAVLIGIGLGFLIARSTRS